jgi:hypothetical protein
LPNYPAFEGRLDLDDTKGKRSRRVVKLQGFVLKALDGVRNSQLLATEALDAKCNTPNSGTVTEHPHHQWQAVGYGES